MTTMTAKPTADFNAILEAIAPARGSFSFFGLLDGYRTYQVFTHLNALSDEDLESYGLSRRDLPKVALQTVQARKQA